jgi:Ran GTPase-activating protein 1
MSSSSKILSTKREVLSFNSRADIEPWLKDVDPTIIEEVHFGGSTIGVEAAVALAEFLKKTTVLKVSI